MPYGEGNPQIEDGFARIANETLEALAQTELTGGEGRCILYLWRKTYGWSDKKGKAKKDDAISYSQWAAGTGMDRRNIMRTLDGLVERKILTKKIANIPGRNPVTIWSFQKKYREWNGYHEAEVVSFQPLLPIQVVSTEPLLSHEVVTSTPLPSYEVVAPTTKVVSSAPLEVVSSAPPTIDKKDNTKDNSNPFSSPSLKKTDETKGHYGEADNVLLTAKEFEKLVEKFGADGAQQRIDKLSTYMGSKGKAYKSHYLTILHWETMNHSSGGNGGNGHTSGGVGKLPTSEQLKESWGV